MNANLKTIVESGKWNINVIEKQIRDYCFNTNLEIIKLENIKTEFLMRKLYVNIKGEANKLEKIKNYLHKITFDLN